MRDLLCMTNDARCILKELWCVRHAARYGCSTDEQDSLFEVSDARCMVHSENCMLDRTVDKSGTNAEPYWGSFTQRPSVSMFMHI